MCKIMEDMRNEAALDNARETARRMIKDGELSLEKIARYIPSLSMDELKELEAEVMQLAKSAKQFHIKKQRKGAWNSKL